MGRNKKRKFITHEEKRSVSNPAAHRFKERFGRTDRGRKNRGCSRGWNAVKSRDAPSSSFSNNQASSSSSSSGGIQVAQEESDIPGFYYDKEKKTYFKILPNTMSSLSSFVTPETIKKRQAEEQRLADMEVLSVNKTIWKEDLGPFSKKGARHIEKTNLVDMLTRVQCGQFTCENFRTRMIRHSCLTLRPENECVSRWPLDNNLKIEDIQKLMVNAKRDKLVGVWSLKSSIAQCLQLMSVNEDACTQKRKGKSSSQSLSIKETVTIGPIFKKVTTLCWAPLPSLPGQNTILYTTTCPIGYSPTIVYLNNLDASTPEARNVFELNLGKKMVWSSAWNSNRSQFSVGSERVCSLVDVATRRMWTYNVGNSDPLAQAFSQLHNSIMYSGTRAGLIFKHDTRTPGKGSAYLELKQTKGISCLRLLRDENYILASDFSGNICQWDQRLKKIVCRLKGFVNSHYQLPFNVDETESVVCGVGSDSYTRLWDKKSSIVLKEVPPPYPASLEAFPIAHFSTGWINGRAGPALVVAMRNRFQIYR